MLPDFTDEGRLPPGVHVATLGEVEERLGFTRRRTRLIEGLRRALVLMRGCGVERVYLDGSFVTDKPRPGDVDGCYDVGPGTDLRSMYPIWPLTPLNRERSKRVFGAEFFPADVIEGASGEPFVSFSRPTPRATAGESCS